MTRFESKDLRGSTFREVDLRDSHFREVWFGNVVMRGVALVDVDIDGEIDNLRINGVDVVPLVEAELDRLMPDRLKMRPTDADGFREAWAIAERLCTVDRAQRLTCPSTVWSRTQTCRWTSQPGRASTRCWSSVRTGWPP